MFRYKGDDDRFEIDEEGWNCMKVILPRSRMRCGRPLIVCEMCTKDEGRAEVSGVTASATRTFQTFLEKMTLSYLAAQNVREAIAATHGTVIRPA